MSAHDPVSPENQPVMPSDPTEAEQAASLRALYEARFGTAAMNIRILDETNLPLVTAQLAEQLHNNWATQYITTHRTGTGADDFEPRWKSIGDDFEWLSNAQQNPTFARTLRCNPQTGDYEVDIARIPFALLPRNPWVVENWVAAMQAVAITHYAIATKTRLDTTLLERASAEIHNMWVYRHPYVMEEAGTPEEEMIRAVQRLAYNHPDFTEIERNKDREHIVLAAEMYAQVARKLAASPGRKFDRIPLRKLVRAATHTGNALLTRILSHPETPLSQESEPLLSSRELTEQAGNMITTVQRLTAGWEQTEIALTDEGDIVRTYMHRSANPSDPEAPHAIYTAQIRYTGDKYQQAGSVTLSHFGPPYDTYFFANLGSTRNKETMQPKIYFNVEHRYTTSPGAHGRTNTRAALEGANTVIDWVSRSIATSSESSM